MTTKSDAIMNTPPVAVVGATILGYSLPDIAAAITIVYTAMLIYFRIRKEWKKRRGEDAGETDRASLE